MMKSSIYLVIALVTLSTAHQLHSGPKILKEDTSSSAASKNSNKRYATQEIILYLTPSEIKGLQALKNGDNKDSLVENQREQQLSLQNSNIDEQQKAWTQYFKSLESEESKDQQQNVFYPKARPAYENQGAQDSVDAYNFGWRQNNNEQQQAAKNQQERERQESKWIPYNPVSAKKQEEALLHEQLQQQWNRILNHNRAQLKGLSSISSENQRPEVSNESERPVIQWQSPSKKQEQKKSDVEKQIENILREASNIEKQGETERYSQQRPPVVIHKEVRIINHHPVPVVERVKVSVPRPVLVPVPEPYEVKVPHPYPVPLEIVKHIPIPIISHK